MARAVADLAGGFLIMEGERPAALFAKKDPAAEAQIPAPRGKGGRTRAEEMTPCALDNAG